LSKQTREIYITGNSPLDTVLGRIAERLDYVEGLRADLSEGYYYLQDGKLITTNNDPLLVEDVIGTDDKITVTDNGDGTITITIPDTYLPASVLGTTNQITVTDNGDGTITLSTPQDIHTGASPTFAALTRIGTALNNLAVSASGNLSFNGTARIDWTKHTANAVTTTFGTPTGSVTDLQTRNDGNVYQVAESASDGIQTDVTFTNVSAFNWIGLLTVYKGIASHIIGVLGEIAPFDGSAWATLTALDSHGSIEYYEDYSVFVPDCSVFINSGAVKIRFIHSSSSSAGHNLHIDEVALYQ